MSDDTIMGLAFFALLIAMVLILAFFQPVAFTLMAWSAARVQKAEARLLEAQNEARRIALAEQEKGDV